MNEAAGLFESISNSRWFAQSSVILFLNKTDLFKGEFRGWCGPRWAREDADDIAASTPPFSQRNSSRPRSTSTTRTTRARPITRRVARTWRASSARCTGTRRRGRSLCTLPARREPHILYALLGLCAGSVLTVSGLCSDTEQLKETFASVEESILQAAIRDLVSACRVEGKAHRTNSRLHHQGIL